jgi:hypothetical protein
LNTGKRGRRRGSDGRAQGGSSLGELVPNRLSIDLRPNELSILAGPTRAASPIPVQPSERPRTAPATARRSRSGLSWLLFLGFIALWILPRITDFLPGGGAPATTAPEPVATVGAGRVDFGAVAGADCVLSGRQDAFKAGSEIWWSARFAAPLRPDEQVRWLVVFRGEVVAQTLGPSDPPTGPWNSLCGSKPLSYVERGPYQLRIVHATTGAVLAEGTFTIE